MLEQKLLEQIKNLHYSKYFIKETDSYKVESKESQLWSKYYQLKKIKHPHDLFKNFAKLSKIEQQEKIKKIAENKNYNNQYFANPFDFMHKDYWEYAAKVIIKRGYLEVENVIPELFVWLQDINWPGSYDIFQFLCSIPKDAILKYFEDTVKEAIRLSDEIWLFQLQRLMYHFKLTENDFKDKQLFEILNQEIDY